MRLEHVLLILLLSALSSIALTALGLLYTEHVSMMDSVYTKYGFPYWWIVHVTVTFAGAANIWHYETPNLAKDVALFFLLSLGIGFLILFSKQRKTQTTKEQSDAKMLRSP
jgi:hypothetical protein